MSWGFIFQLREYHSAPRLTAGMGYPCHFRNTAAL